MADPRLWRDGASGHRVLQMGDVYWDLEEQQQARPREGLIAVELRVGGWYWDWTRDLWRRLGDDVAEETNTVATIRAQQDATERVQAAAERMEVARRHAEFVQRQRAFEAEVALWQREALRLPPPPQTPLVVTKPEPGRCQWTQHGLICLAYRGDHPQFCYRHRPGYPERPKKPATKKPATKKAPKKPPHLADQRLEPCQCARCRGTEAPPPLEPQRLPVPVTPARTGGESHYLADEIERRSRATEAWAPWARRTQRRSRRYEGWSGGR